MKHPTAIVVDFKKCRYPAQTYVMLSRAERLSQVFILDNLYLEKWTVSESALNELKDTEANAMNICSQKVLGEVVIVSLNIFSLLTKFHEVKQIVAAMKPDVICIQETWLQPGVHQAAEFQLQEYDLHLVSSGKGKGIATFFSKEFSVCKSIHQSDLQMTKVCSKALDVINVYRSSKGRGLETQLSLMKGRKICLVCGDMNIDLKKAGPEQRHLNSYLREAKMKFMVKSTTHDKGGLLDHVYVSEEIMKQTTVEQKAVRFSDHDLLIIKVGS